MGGQDSSIEQYYLQARDRFGDLGVDAEGALRKLSGISVSLHCWQGDDVAGFENDGSELGGGLAVTGNYPGKARTPRQLRSDVDKVMSLLPGRHRFNLHALYAETGGKRVERNDLEPSHFADWIAWAKSKGIALDFNPSFFAHPKAADGFTLAHPDPAIRRFWIEHGIACRKIGAEFGRQLGSACITNVWIPDGYKDTPVDRKGPRELLNAALDAIFAESIDPAAHLDAVEGKLFGIGSESYVVGSHEFYLGYAIRNRKLLCLDCGHYHPTESVADKISAVLQSLDRVLLHVSRGVRWDSDHVVTLSDDIEALAQEIVRGGYLDRVFIALDFFDASINRLAAWVIGTRSVLRALLMALLEPTARLRKAEADGDLTSRLAMLEEYKNLPYAAVWDYHCLKSGVPVGLAWLDEVKTYEREVLSKR